MKLVEKELGKHQISADIGCHLFASLPPFEGTCPIAYDGQERTYRFRGHSMGDPEQYRTKEEVERYEREHDPVGIFKSLPLDQKKMLARMANSTQPGAERTYY